jgi:hypothetical protein
VVQDISDLLDAAHGAGARNVNAFMMETSGGKFLARLASGPGFV